MLLNILLAYYKYDIFYILWNPRGGMSTIPACNAVRHDLLHIIDFCHARFILRLPFEGTRTRWRSVSGKMHWNSDGHELFIVRCSTLRTFGDYVALKVFTIIKTQTVCD